MLNTGFGWILLACTVFGITHSLLASNSAKRLAARLLGDDIRRRYYRLFFSTMGGFASLLLAALVGLLPDQAIYQIPIPWVFLTITIQGLAAIMIVHGVVQTGAMHFLGFDKILEKRREGEPDFLVVNGLYRWVRHPLYTASFALLWLMPVMTWNLLALAVGLSIYMWVGTIFEEQKLVESFGQEYEEYRRRTPRIFPWPWYKKSARSGR